MTSAVRKVALAWEALEDAFENNAPDIHSFLHVGTGDVLRLVDGTSEPSVRARVADDPQYIRVDPVSSREQYRWMERFIPTVADASLREELQRAIDGKGAFRRFKDGLADDTLERERWFQFRSERLKAAIDVWLKAHRIEATVREHWPVPTEDDVRAKLTDAAPDTRGSRVDVADDVRNRLRALAEVVPQRDLDAAVAFLEFLRDRKRLARASGGRGRARGATSTARSRPSS